MCVPSCVDTLPLSVGGRVAVIGPYRTHGVQQGGKGGVDVEITRLNVGGKTTSAAGCAISGSDKSGFQAAVKCSGWRWAKISAPTRAFRFLEGRAAIPPPECFILSETLVLAGLGFPPAVSLCTRVSARMKSALGHAARPPGGAGAGK